MSPSWLMPISAMTSGGWSGPILRFPSFISGAMTLLRLGSISNGARQREARPVFLEQELGDLEVQLGVDVGAGVQRIHDDRRRALSEEVAAREDHIGARDVD